MPGMSHKFIGKYYYYYLSVLILPPQPPPASSTARPLLRCRLNLRRDPDPFQSIVTTRAPSGFSWPRQRLRDWGLRSPSPLLGPTAESLGGGQRRTAGRLDGRPRNFTISHLWGKRACPAPSRASFQGHVPARMRSWSKYFFALCGISL